jgi:hypothetical protein
VFRFVGHILIVTSHWELLLIFNEKINVEIWVIILYDFSCHLKAFDIATFSDFCWIFPISHGGDYCSSRSEFRHILVFEQTSFTGQVTKETYCSVKKNFDANSCVFNFSWRNKGVADSVWFIIEVYLKSLEMIRHLPITCVKLQSCKICTSQVRNMILL